MTKIGFIGLGIMGRPMADHLLEGGHELFVHTRRAPPKELIDKGAVACANGKEVGQKAEVIITMVPDTPDVEAVLFGAGGVAEGLSKGKVVVDMSSISPDRHQGVRQKGQRTRLRISRRSGFRRRGRRQGGESHHHGWRPGERVREGQADLRAHG